MSRFSSLVVSTFLLLRCLAPAQSDTATISGRITDQTGQVLAGAQVKVTTVETGGGVSTLTNPDGIYADAVCARFLC